jgi:hydrogenase maturation protein HypF
MLLEGLAARHGPAAALAKGYRLVDGGLDLLPLAEALLGERDAGRGAAIFHSTLVDALAAWCIDAARAHGLETVAFGGGCFNNRILTEGLRQRLLANGLEVLEARQAPPNDGGLSLGQAWIGRLMTAAPSLH